MRIADVMQKDPVTFRPDQRLTDVEEVLVRHRITGAPVVRDGRPVGVISRTDLVRQLELERSRMEAAQADLDPYDAEDSVPPLAISSAVARRWVELRVEDAMRHQVFDVEPGASVAEGARRMVEHRIHRLAVTEGGKLVGIVSSLDLLRVLAAQDG